MENNIKKILNKYLPNLKVEIKKFEIENLPLFYKKSYELKKVLINNIPYVLVYVKDKTLGPRQFKKHEAFIKEKTNSQIIWYMSHLHYHKVQRLIGNGINFIVESGQIHLPSINISIKPENEKEKYIKFKLNEWSVNILERQLLKRDLNGKSKQEIANIFQITKMTAGRSIEQILTNDICYEKKNGVYKYIYFKEKVELWEFFKKNVASPVKEVFYLKNNKVSAPLSGISALSRHTMISDDQIKVHAISGKDFKKNYNEKDLAFQDNAIQKIEVWNRKPILVVKDTINPIDIYLVLRDDSDERIKIELESLLKNYDLKI